VSTVKFNMNKQGKESVAKKTKSTPVGKDEQRFTLSELLKASRLAEELGGVEKA